MRDILNQAHNDDVEVLSEYHDMHIGSKLGLKRYTMKVYELGRRRGKVEAPIPQEAPIQQEETQVQ